MISPHRLARRAVRLIPLLLLALTLLPATGCGLLFGGSPSAANIQLRKEKQALEEKVAELEARSEADSRLITSLREAKPTTQSLSAARLGNLWTTHGLKFARLTGGWDKDSKTPGDEGIRVYVAPIDQNGEAIKMSGTFTVELFDLADTKQPFIGKWEFDVASARKSWRGVLMSYEYVLECPWQDRKPNHEELTLKVTFVDELTQLPFHAQQVVKVSVPVEEGTEGLRD